MLLLGTGVMRRYTADGVVRKMRPKNRDSLNAGEGTEWEGIFASYSMDKGLISDIQRTEKLNNRRANNSINKWQMNQIVLKSSSNG
jgi:hypothetical protein